MKSKLIRHVIADSKIYAPGTEVKVIKKHSLFDDLYLCEVNGNQFYARKDELSN